VREQGERTRRGKRETIVHNAIIISIIVDSGILRLYQAVGVGLDIYADD